MLLERISIKGLLSFCPEGIDLPLRPLNVLIGPKGSGKSHLVKPLPAFIPAAVPESD
jgi:predicted ATPase